MDITFRKIEASDQTEHFDCGDASLNEYLRKYARQQQRRMFGVTYVAVCCSHPPHRVVGYFTLANTSAPRDHIPERLLRGIPKYQGLPAFLLARLAVDKSFHRKRIGEALLARCLECCLTISKCSGARYVIAEAVPSAIAWYKRFGFQVIEGAANPDLTKMLLDLAVADSAIDRKAIRAFSWTALATE